MTSKQALTLARKRWGKRAAIQRRKSPPYKITHAVGVIWFGAVFEVKGQGMNWKACFDYADERGR